VTSFSDPALSVAVFQEQPLSAHFEVMDPGNGELVSPEPVVVRGPQGSDGNPGPSGNDGRLLLADGQTPTDGALVVWSSTADGAVATTKLDGGFF